MESIHRKPSVVNSELGYGAVGCVLQWDDPGLPVGGETIWDPHSRVILEFHEENLDRLQQRLDRKNNFDSESCT